LGGGSKSALTQERGICLNSECMEIYDAVKGIVAILKFNPLFYRAEVIS
jgi:hypothetical protein